MANSIVGFYGKGGRWLLYATLAFALLGVLLYFFIFTRGSSTENTANNTASMLDTDTD